MKKGITIDDLRKVYQAMGKVNREETYCLHFSRMMWEKVMPKNGYSFTKEELDRAENMIMGFIGIQKGVRCYLVPNKYN